MRTYSAEPYDAPGWLYQLPVRKRVVNKRRKWFHIRVALLFDRDDHLRRPRSRGCAVMTAMEWLADLPAGLYRGRVSGAESGSCEARIEVARVAGNCLAVDYEGVGADGVQHVEHTLVDENALYVAHSETTGVHVFHKIGDGTFDGPPGGPYDQRLVIGWDGHVLTWAWWWARAGGDLREQSRATTCLADA